MVELPSTWNTRSSVWCAACTRAGSQRCPSCRPYSSRQGQTLASVENGTRLLEEDQLVAVYPEGIKGVGKLYKDRYRLARFGRGGFVRMALRAQAPIIPVSVVGAEETYMSLYKSEAIAKLIGFPFFPITHLAAAGFVRLHPLAVQVVHRLRRADSDGAIWP